MSTPTTSYWKESTVIFTLALPIIANGILESSSSFINIFLVAHLGPTQLAANALVSGLFFTLMVIFWGLISAVSIVISHHHGANNDEGIAGTLRAGVYLALILSLPIMLLLWFAPYFFRWTGQSPLLIDEARQYLHALALAVPSDLIGFTLMQLFPGLSRPKITFYLTLLYLPLMVALNYLFMFGKWGFPRLGLAGIGWGTAISYTAILIIIVIFIAKNPYYRRFWQLPIKNFTPYFKELLRVGVPLGFTYCLELGYFFTLALLMGKISGITLAAHQIAIQYFWISMIGIYSFGQALTIRLGWHIGRKEIEWLMPLLIIGQCVALIWTGTIALIYSIFPLHLIAFDLGHYPPLQALFTQQTIKFFRLLALFQIIDGMRTTCLSLLRGLKETRFTLIMAIAAFWLLAVPVGYVLCFHVMQRNPAGLWLGGMVGGGISVFVMLYRLKMLSASKKQGA